MATASLPLSLPDRHATPPRHGDRVFVVYWIAAAALVMALVAGVRLDGAGATLAGTLLFLGGGLPHGAYDIALLRRAVVLERRQFLWVIGGYVGAVVAMLLLWMAAPLTALILFLAVAAVHFGEDWQMLEEPLLRVAAGVAVIAAATIGHPRAVEAIFVTMSDARAVFVAQAIVAVAPVALLVTAVGIAIAWRNGSRGWAAAMALCLALLLVAPPVFGFALFFVFLHSPRHLAATRTLLADMPRGRWIGTGVVLSIAALAGWVGLQGLVPMRLTGDWTAQAFQLLAAVAVPHLLLSRWLARRVDSGLVPPKCAAAHFQTGADQS